MPTQSMFRGPAWRALISSEGRPSWVREGLPTASGKGGEAGGGAEPDCAIGAVDYGVDSVREESVGDGVGAKAAVAENADAAAQGSGPDGSIAGCGGRCRRCPGRGRRGGCMCAR